MANENATAIGALDATFPADTDPVKEGAGHIRMIKKVLLAAFGDESTNTVPLSWLANIRTAFSALADGKLTTNARLISTDATAPEANQLVTLAQAKLAPYPVGCIALFGKEVDPNTALGGKWTELAAGYSLRTAAKNATLAPAGSDSVKLAIANLPAHNHTFTGGKTNAIPDHYHNLFGTGSADGASGANSYPADGRNSHETTMTGSHVMSGAGGHTHTVTGTISSVGSGAAFSVAGAVYNVRAWMRTA